MIFYKINKWPVLLLMVLFVTYLTWYDFKSMIYNLIGGFVVGYIFVQKSFTDQRSQYLRNIQNIVSSLFFEFHKFFRDTWSSLSQWNTDSMIEGMRFDTIRTNEYARNKWLFALKKLQAIVNLKVNELHVLKRAIIVQTGYLAWNPTGNSIPKLQL